MKKILVLIALIGTIIPALFVITEAGGLANWQGVPAKGVTDSLYYYARIHEVADGYPLVGNPFAYEHRAALSPAFFLPDVISALPLLGGLPFNLAIILNVFIWSVVFLLLLFTLLRLLRLSKRWSFFVTVISYLGAYSFLLRPTVMQLVYPTFLLFLITLLMFLYDPFNRRRQVWLSGASALTFYVYTYLSYIAFLSLAFAFGWFLFARRKEVRSLLWVALYTAVLAIPSGIYTLMQIKGPYYFETFERIGLVMTRIPSLEAFLYGRWIVIGLIAWVILWRMFPSENEGQETRKIFWLSTGVGLMVGLFLNVITGVELTLGVHIGRFVTLWTSIVLGVVAAEWCKHWRSVRPKYGQYLVFLTLLLLLLLGVSRNIIRGMSFFQFDNRGEKIAILQPYGAPLRWLEENITKQSVVWANDSLSQYIPIMTRHYPLFSPGVALHNISSEELEDRYLLSRISRTLTVEDVKRDFGLILGAGPLKLQPLAHNQRVWLCQKTARYLVTRDCPAPVDAVTLRGEEYFRNLVQRFDVIKKNQAQMLSRFNVRYLLVDRTKDQFVLKDEKNVLYDDGRFVILSLPL